MTESVITLTKSLVLFFFSIPVLVSSLISRIPPKTVLIEPVQASTHKNPVQTQIEAVNAIPANNIWDGYPDLKQICSCESWGDKNKEPRQFKNGVLLLGYPNPNDVGACQINRPIWQATALKMGDNINLYAGNVAFAKHLYDLYGKAPWIYSRTCWSVQDKTN